MAVCPKCGAQIPEGSMFCGACGVRFNVPAAAPAVSPEPVKTAKPKASGKGRLPLGIVIGAVLTAAAVAVMSLLGIVTFGKPAAEGGRIEGSGYDSPGAATRAYVEAWADQDLDAMLATFAIETHAEHFDRAERNKAIASMINEINGFSEDDPARYFDYYFAVGFPLTATAFTKDLSVELRTDEITKYIRAQYLRYALRGLTNAEIKNDASTVGVGGDEASYRLALQRLADPDLFADIRVVSVRDWTAVCDAGAYEEYRRNSVMLREDYQASAGIEDYTETAVEVEINGESWLLFLTQAKYNGRWYNYYFENQLQTILAPDAESDIGLVPKP